MRHQLGDGIGRDEGVGIDADEQLLRDLLQTVVQGIGLARIRFGKHGDAPGRNFFGESRARDFQRRVLRAVVNHDNAQILVVGIEHRTHRALDHLLLVVGRDQHGDRRAIVGIEAGLAPVEAVIDGERADQDQPSGHQYVADKENEDDERLHQSEQRKVQAIDPGRPALIGRDGRHHLGARLAHQFGDRYDLVAAFLQAIQDHAQRFDRLAAIAAAVVQQNDVAATQIAGSARRQIRQHVGGDLIWPSGADCRASRWDRFSRPP